ncbi:MAG TPA: hypothetical protein VM487_08860 [Phycisphaerae bacterium]|nr:hypothetical protein [Phycisphaerae bacterium]
MNEQTKQPTDYERGWREACDSIDGQLTPLSVDDAEYVGDVIDSARARKCSLLPKDLHEPQLLEACRFVADEICTTADIHDVRVFLDETLPQWAARLEAAIADATGEHNQ